METENSLKNVNVNKYGQTILTSDKLRDILLQGKNISHLNVVRDEEIDLYEKFQSDLLTDVRTIFLDEPLEDLDFDSFHVQRSSEWIFPQEYQQIDVRAWLLDKCKSQEQIDRVHEEYSLFEDRDLIMLLRLFIFLVSYMRKKEFVWGVGRGSSVCSYILYLIGVHRVDSLHYQLDIRDYLK